MKKAFSALSTLREYDSIRSLQNGTGSSYSAPCVDIMWVITDYHYPLIMENHMEMNMETGGMLSPLNLMKT